VLHPTSSVFYVVIRNNKPLLYVCLMSPSVTALIGKITNSWMCVDTWQGCVYTVYKLPMCTYIRNVWTDFGNFAVMVACIMERRGHCGRWLYFTCSSVQPLKIRESVLLVWQLIAPVSVTDRYWLRCVCVCVCVCARACRRTNCH
jgi:hypothetical protein